MWLNREREQRRYRNKKIEIWNLKGERVREFNNNVYEKLSKTPGKSVEDKWMEMKSSILT